MRARLDINRKQRSTSLPQDFAEPLENWRVREDSLRLGMVNRVVPLAELRTASLNYAKRLSLISPEALYATKRAVNGVADAAGFRSGLYAGLDIVGPLYATTTELGARFREIAAREGVPAAVRWRSAQFKE